MRHGPRCAENRRKRPVPLLLARPQAGDQMTAPHELDEWRAAVHDLDEAERAANCGHTCRGRRGVCVHCGDEPDS